MRTERRSQARRRRPAQPTVTAIERLEDRTLLSWESIYPDLVPTVGEYDENATQPNTVDAVAAGSSMTDAQFAADLASAWANGTGGVIDGTGHSQVFGIGQNTQGVLHIVTWDDTNWTLGSPTDRPTISGDGAFSTIFAPSQGGYNALNLYFGVESFDSNQQVLSFGMTTLGQTLAEYGTVYLYGHLAFGGSMLITHQVPSGGAEDVFYGLTAPAADYFIGFTLAYAPEGEWIVDQPLWFDDFGFITGDYMAGGNQAPTANDDTYSLSEDASLTTYASYGWPGDGVLGNDFDPESHDLTAILVSGPAHGTLTWNFDGGFTYTPDANFSGTDSFTYKAHDSFDESNVATVTLTVTPADDPPTALDDAFTLDEDSALAVGGPGLLANDSDPEGDPLTAALVTGPAHGTLTLADDGSFVYTPDADFSGTDSFTYQALAGGAASNVAVVSLTVNDVNDAPVAAADSYTVGEDETLDLRAALTAELTMVSEPGDWIGQGLTYDLDHTTGTFTAKRNYDNGVSIRYTDGAGEWWHLDFAAPGEVPLTAGVYTGAMRFPFQDPDAPGLDVSGNGRGSNTLTGQFTVHEVVYGAGGEVLVFDASFEQHSEGHDAALTGHVRFVAAGPEGVLANDTDSEGDPLTVFVTGYPDHGTLTLNSDGTFKYTPDADFHGTDTFTYRAYDGVLMSEAVTVTITVLPSNDAPAANGQAVIADEDAPYAGSVTATDVDGDLLQFALVDGPANGTLVLNLDGSFVYTPHANFHGTDTFTYSASDGTAQSNVATVTITVNSVNDAPVANGQSVSVAEDGSYSGSVTATDVDGDPLQFTLVDGPANGTLVLNADGTFTYTPAADFHGTDGFTFIAHDGSTASQPAAVAITVDPVNDAPTLSGATFALAENSGVGTTVGTVSGSDIDGDALTYQIAGGNASGAFTIDAATGEIRVSDATPLDFETTPEFNLTVRVSDAGGLVATATVIVALTDVDETLVVTIDVLPGDATNTISSQGHGRTEVAILSTAGSDAQDLDVESLRFGRTGAENSLSWKNGNPVYYYEDVNDDGLLDLIVQFERDLMGFFAGDTQAHLTGQTLDGTDIAGEDDVNLTGNWPGA